MKLPKPDWQTVGDTQYDIAMPSGRIWHALAAMEVVELLTGFDINMSVFRGKLANICLACCGGAARLVKENRLTCDTFITHVAVAPDEHETSLDYARFGDTERMFRFMNLDGTIGMQFDRRIANYHIDKLGFYKDMNKIASDLYDAGW